MLIDAILAVIIGALLIASLLLPLENCIKAISKIELKADTSANSCSSIEANKNLELEKCTNPESIRLKQLSSGFSLIEVLFMSLISISLVALSMLVLSRVISSSRVALIKLDHLSVALRVSAEVERITGFSEFHPLSISPKVHKAGEIRLANSDKNAVLKGNMKLRPAINSDAITNINLKMDRTLNVISCNNAGTYYQGRACLRYSNSLDQFKTYLLYSLDGYQEASGTISGTGKCRDFTLNTANGMYFSSDPQATKCNLIAIVPIVALQTIYFSEQGDLRLITHQLQINAENQPLTEKISGLSLKLLQQPDSMYWQLLFNNQEIASKNIKKLFLSDSQLNFFFN